MSKIDFSKVKLVIWDLDNTFWKGAISEEGIEWDDENVRIIKNLDSVGIINSICSKNDFGQCKTELEKHDVWGYFIMPSIDFTEKGDRIKQIVSACQLRAENVLFIDDQIHNLKETEYINSGIMTVLYNDEFQREIWDWVSNEIAKNNGVNKSRLAKYKLIEEKNNFRENLQNNEEFLVKSEISCDVRTDCGNNLERIHELILRTNQLNYTKKRISIEQLTELVNDSENQCAYISVKDRFGDYGVVGFYALKNGVLEHFLFSCRVLGMGIEQYIYSELGFPDIDIVGDVSVTLDKRIKPSWINIAKNEDVIEQSGKNKKIKKKLRILVKGPCDVQSMQTYFEYSLPDEFTYEVTYVSEKNGKGVASYNTTTQILASKYLPSSDKEELIKNFGFIDKNYYNTKIFDEHWDIIIYSCLEDYGTANYFDGNKYVSFGSDKINLNDLEWRKIYEDEWEAWDDNTYKSLSEYEYKGLISEEQFKANLSEIVGLIGKDTKFVFINAAEQPYTGEGSDYYWKTRGGQEIINKRYNDVLKKFCQENDNCYLADINNHVKSSEDYTDAISHYKRWTYFELSEEIVGIIKEIKNGVRDRKRIRFYWTKFKFFVKKHILSKLKK